MNLEPRLVDEIKSGRRSKSALKALVLGSTAILLALVLVYIVVPYLAGNTTFSPLIRKTTGAGSVLVLLIVALLADIGFALLYIPGMKRDRAFYATLVARAKKFDPGSLGLFMNALESASARLEVEEPGLAILASKQPNALTFERDGRPVIGITRGLLGAGLSYTEAECVLAHQLASIITDDFLRRPGARAVDFVAYVLLGAFSLVGVAGAAMAGAGRAVWIGVFVLLGVALVLFFEGWMMRKVVGPRKHDYLLDDSIAASVTGRPDALAGVIRRLDGLVNGRSRGSFPANEFGLEYFFVMPYKWNDTPESFVKRRHADLKWDSKDATKERQIAGVRSTMDDLADRGQRVLTERLSNLEQNT